MGLSQADDAAAWRLGSEQALVATVDFITPVVDDPFDYGAIAAANALSDIYAMGGRPFLALNVAALPPDLPEDLLAGILQGGAEKVREAGAVVAGASGVAATGASGACVSAGNHCGKSIGPATNQPRITRKLSTVARMRFLF